jgi:RES domain-containing protein
MVLWRISNHAALDGLGGLISSARWHTQGHRVVYLAESAAGALIELLVHLELSPDMMPGSYQLLKIQAPGSVSREHVPLSSLTGEWRIRLAETRSIGDRWLDEQSSALLQIPSAIVPETWNWMLNPSYGDASTITIEGCFPLALDPRLVR